MDASTIKALTFDCYGTLIDWESGILRALRPLFAVRGQRPPDEELLRHYVQFEAEYERAEYRSYRDVLTGVSVGLAEHYGLSFEDRELDRLADSIASWSPFPDTVESLRLLSGRFRLAICSNIDDDLFEATNERLARGFEFERVVTASYCRSYKPDPRHLRVALALLDLPPDQVLHVAQSRYHDIAPARALGLRTAWVNRASLLPNTGVTLDPPPGTEPDLSAPDLRTLAPKLLR